MSNFKILIADAGKASVVMTSEVFKDKSPGSVVTVVGTGKECLKYIESNPVDLCVVDFDLPDTDGITLITSMREIFQRPILLTAYPDPLVEKAVQDNLFAFCDAGAWLSKPINVEELAEKIELFLVKNQRLERRFPLMMPTVVVGKGAGRGHRAPKSGGLITNISCGGVMLDIEATMRVKRGDELALTLEVPSHGRSCQGSDVMRELKLKTTVAWVEKTGKRLGLKFCRLTELQRKGLDRLLRSKADK